MKSSSNGSTFYVVTIILNFLNQSVLRATLTTYAEEILLENVELILEAFDYLQLPFALKQGIFKFIGKMEKQNMFGIVVWIYITCFTFLYTY